MELGSPNHGIVPKTVHKTLPWGWECRWWLGIGYQTSKWEAYGMVGVWIQWVVGVAGGGGGGPGLVGSRDAVSKCHSIDLLPTFWLRD